MKANFSTKFKKSDIFVIVFAVVAIVVSIVTTNIHFSSISDSEKVVEVYFQGKLLKEKSLKMSEVNEQKEIVLAQDEYKGLLGDVTILVDKEKGICIKDVTCPNHICENMGWVNMVAYPITCLPNNVVVLISATDPNQDIILG